MSVNVDIVADTITQVTWVLRVARDAICDCGDTSSITPVAPAPTALSSVLILWPLRTPGISVRVTTGAATETLGVVLAQGRNYWMSGDGQADSSANEGAGDFLAVLQALLNTNSGGGTYSVQLTSDFVVKIAVTGVASFSILWASGSTTSGLGTMFGFTGSTPSAASATGVLLPYGIWRPGLPFWKDTRDREPTVGGVAVSLAGYSRISSLIDAPKKERAISFLRVRQEYALREFQFAAQPTGSFEAAWVNAMKLGRAFRVYPDETNRTASSYGLYRLKSLVDPLIRDNDIVTRWNVDPLEMRSV